MKLTAELLYGFSTGVLQSRFDAPVATPSFHMDLWRLCCSEHRQVAIAAPRSHAKTTAVTHTYGLASVLFRAKSHVMIVSDTESQAISFLKDIKLELTENQDLIDLFDINQTLVKDNEAELIVEIGSDRHQFRIIAKGAGQKVRGIKWRNKRPDLIIGDDLENDEMVRSQERRENFRRWLRSALIPCLSDDGEIRIVGTILHLDSALEHLMPKDDMLRNVHLIKTPLAELTDEKEPQWKGVRFRAHDEDFANILWEERFSKQRLLSIRQDYINLGFPDGYSQEYLNYPLDDSVAFVRKTDIRTMTPDDWKKSMVIYVGGDFAISQRNKADYTVFAIVGMDTEGTAYILDIRRGRWDTYEIVEEMLAIQMRFKPEVFYLEKGQIFAAIEPVLQKAIMRNPGGHMNYDTVASITDKMTRARPLQFRFRAGGIRIDNTAPWYGDLELELLRFPKGSHDDQVDALATIFLKLAELSDAPTWRERERSAYEDEVTEHEDNMERDISIICGY